ncbi:DUF3325 domain-containing protein [Cognatiyoonia sp. IB215182]|uniref:DUF3325 domain-containing protein n=1 Tax=Cognatiyoonia sp. IB215182 TaxID=3097353 RepID=UPI002A15D158|nr:DUF3325 domain-containing protein [Cognatiyoonia sp. IB215182]MDX8354814.1 DUF3325 domain-containing protein [Cognatiyoonia sp. IB215182]
MTRNLLPTLRVALALFGGFILAVAVAAAGAHLFVTQGGTSTSDAFFWGAYIAFVVYVAAMIWVFAARDLRLVTLVFAGTILLSGLIVRLAGGDANFGYGAALGQAMLLIVLLWSLWIGFAAFALSQVKHWQAIMGRRDLPAVTARAARWLGWTLLSLSVVVALLRDGWGFGLLLWPMAAFFVALAVSFTVAYAPQMLARLGQTIYSLTVIEGKPAQ